MYTNVTIGEDSCLQQSSRWLGQDTATVTRRPLLADTRSTPGPGHITSQHADTGNILVVIPCSIQSAVVFRQELSTTEAMLRLRRSGTNIQCMLQPPASNSEEKHLIPTVLILFRYLGCVAATRAGWVGLSWCSVIIGG